MTKARQVVAAIALVTAAAAALGQAALAGPTTDPATAAGYGGGWLARRVSASGATTPAGSSDHATAVDTYNTALALAAADVGNHAFGRAVGYLSSHVDDASPPSDEQPAALGSLIMVAVVHGDDPHAFGGKDLVGRLLATKRTSGSDAGLFGSDDPSFDGAFRQSFALFGLKAAGASAPADAVTWLQQQQCDDGGWQSYRSDTSVACQPTDLTNFTGEDTNSTGLAVQALQALGASFDDPRSWLHGAQNSDGGFGFFAGLETDADSTGIVLQALAALGEDPATAWAKGSATPFSALLSLQLGCEAAASDRGAFDFQAEQPLKPNALATEQAVPGAAQKPFPLAAGAPAATEPTVACETASSTTTSSTTSTTVATAATAAAAATTTTTTVAPSAASVSPVATSQVVQPTFTG